jgi:hypothetical protein
VKDITGWGENDRGVSYCFGSDVVIDFLEKHDLSLIARAHQVRIQYDKNKIRGRQTDRHISDRQANTIPTMKT